jgi:hypothetical protein
VRAISCIEGQAFRVDRELVPRLQSAAARLQRRLRPRFPILSESPEGFSINGVVGSIDLGPAMIEVEPKTEPGDDWIHAALDLLIGTDRVDISGERAAGLSQQRRNLLDVLAAIFAARLERALRRDGRSGQGWGIEQLAARSWMPSAATETLMLG